MRFRPFILIIAALFMANLAVGQQLLLRLADSHMKNLNYSAAIDSYKKVLLKNDDNELAKLRLAEAYHKLNDTKNAEYWYSQAIHLTNVDHVHKLYYAQMLQRNGKCESAKKWFQRYAEAEPNDTRGQYLARACEYVNELMTRNADLYEVQRLWFNSPNDDFSPVYYDGGLVFVSERQGNGYVKRFNNWSDKPFLKLFHVKMASNNESEEENSYCNFIYGKPQIFSSNLNSRFHEASASFGSEEQEMFFTRSNFESTSLGETKPSDLYRLHIFRSEREGDEWSEPKKLPFNSSKYSTAHPTLSKDGRFLYFASDMPGGFGGMDIYVVERVGNRWGEPINLGNRINTEGNEVFPSLDHTGRIYFASDGQIGLGGLDLYYTEEIEEGVWSTPENLGYPINTIDDDFSVVFNEQGTCGYFSSNRTGGTGGDDIYSFVKKSASIQVKIIDAHTKEPITSVIVSDNCRDNTLVTNAKGTVVFDLVLNKCCTFTAELEGYHSKTIERCLDEIPPGDLVVLEIALEKELNFGITGIIFDQNTGLPLDNATVQLFNDCQDKQPTSVVTDTFGRFIFPMEQECCYSVRATHASYGTAIQEGHCTRERYDSKMFVTKLYLQSKTEQASIER